MFLFSAQKWWKFAVTQPNLSFCVAAVPCQVVGSADLYKRSCVGYQKISTKDGSLRVERHDIFALLETSEACPAAVIDRMCMSLLSFILPDFSCRLSSSTFFDASS